MVSLSLDSQLQWTYYRGSSKTLAKGRVVFMGIFSSKLKVDIESFCSNYYDSQMFHAIVNGEDGSQKLLDAAFQLLTDSDPYFLKVDRALFDCEMTAMHLELFALAFLKRFSDFDKAVEHSLFTLLYLKNKDRSDILNAMGKYSIAIAKTATMKATGQKMTGESGIERMTITKVNSMRSDYFERWMNNHFSVGPENLTEVDKKIADCVARVCNHLAADILRNNEIGNKQIASLFLNSLGAETIWGENWEPSEDFLLRVASQPYSMYDFATRILKTVDLRFSKVK